MKKKPQHRGRFQAQGNGLEKTVSWTLVSPILKSQANKSIDNLKKKLSPAELSARKECFEKAYNFVKRAPANGVSAFFKYSCVPFPPNKDIRVDIDVLAGVAFIDGKK